MRFCRLLTAYFPFAALMRDVDLRFAAKAFCASQIS